jgi:hypothetical protein
MQDGRLCLWSFRHASGRDFAAHVVAVTFRSCLHRRCRVDCRRQGSVVFRTEKTHMTQSTYSLLESTVAPTSNCSEEVEYQNEAMSYRWTSQTAPVTSTDRSWLI